MTSASTRLPQDFRAIQFGKAAAETEWDSLREVLEDGYLDRDGWEQRVRGDRDLYFLLGAKGSGKSALAYHTETTSMQGSMIAKVYRMGDLSFDVLSQVQASSNLPSHRLLWKILCQCALLDLSRMPPSGQSHASFDNARLDKLLANAGIGVDFDKLTDSTRGRRHIRLTVSPEIFVMPVGKITGSLNFESIPPERRAAALNLNQASELMMEFLTKLDLNEPRIAFLDGIDDALRFGSASFQTLTDLMVAAHALNREFRQNHVDLRLVVLCRDEVWSNLNQAEMQRYRDDNSLTLSWYREGQSYGESALARLIRHRARNHVPPGTDAVEYFLPKLSSGSKQLLKSLFDHTRHVPRDLVNLLNLIQDEMPTSATKPSMAVVNVALKRFCAESFEGEIRNSLEGFLDDGEIRAAMELVALLPKEFTFEKAKGLLSNHPSQEMRAMDAHKILRALFMSNGIGHVELSRYAEPRHSFRYRNPKSEFRYTENCITHPALYRAKHGDETGLR